MDNGRSISMGFGFLAGVRVSGSKDGSPVLKFTPAHIQAGTGKKISHRLQIPVYINSHRGNNGQGKSSLVQLTAWGELARKMALSCSPGSALDALVEINAYQGKVYQNGQELAGLDGQPLKTTRVGFTIMRMIFGEESKTWISTEMAAGRRPIGWNDESNPAYLQWKEELQRRSAMQYTGGDVFGFAKVYQPNGQLLPPEAPAANAAPVQTVATPVAAPVAAVTQAFAPTQTVAPAATAVPAAAPVQTAGFGVAPVAPATVAVPAGV